MLGNIKRHARADPDQLALEPLVGERLESATVVADEVMVVPDTVPQRLEADDALPHLDACNELGVLELLEDAVDAGARNRTLVVLERRLYLDR